MYFCNKFSKIFFKYEIFVYFLLKKWNITHLKIEFLILKIDLQVQFKQY